MDTKNNANDAYREARERLDARLNKINNLIRTHTEEQFKNKRSWGFVGEMNEVVEILDHAIDFLGGKKETTT